jgi:hypothetical protein
MSPQTSRALVLPAMLLLGCGDCASNSLTHVAERSARAEREQPAYVPLHIPPEEQAGAESQPLNTRLFQVAGTVDFQNRYSSTVMISLDAPMKGARCSGVLLGPRTALTAGSCVCTRQKHGSDEPACAKRVYVTAIEYGEAYTESLADMGIRPQAGKVRPHPGFRLSASVNSSVGAGAVDLAVIVLDKPISPSPTGARFGRRDLQPGEFITMVGYGYGEEVGQIFGLRYFRKNQLTKVLPEGRALYEQQGPFLYHGYHGGPCFREDENGQWLVGIASKGSADGLALVSTYFHRDWILAEMDLTAGDEAPIPGSSTP